MPPSIPRRREEGKGATCPPPSPPRPYSARATLAAGSRADGLGSGLKGLLNLLFFTALQLGLGPRLIPGNFSWLSIVQWRCPRTVS
jgi:hypothetical protein